MWPTEDDRDLFQVLIPRLQSAREKYDYVPLPHHEYFGPQAWDERTNSSLPGTWTPYFLRSGTGPRYSVAGVIVTPLITTAESNGVFAVASIEGSSHHQHNPLNNSLTFSRSHHCFYVTDGYINIVLDGQNVQVGPTETAYIPMGNKFSLKFESRYVKAYVFCNGGGLVESLCKGGTPYKHSMIPERDSPADLAALKALGNTYGFQLDA